jgi:hypothetical protein
MKSENPSSDHDWTVHSLNIHGMFFERWSEHTVGLQPHWFVKDKQYPVAFSPTVGPLHRTSGHESTLDLRAVMSYGDSRLLNLLIECKKNNPEFVEWMFFLKAGKRSISTFIAPAVSCRNAQNPSERPILQPMLKALYLELPIAEEARETRGNYQSIKTDRNKTKTANDSISNAAHQVALATQAIFLEEASNNLPDPPIKAVHRVHYEKQVFLPVILTTARLHTCEFDPKEISPIEGTIPYDKVSITEQPYLIYTYPLPVHLQLDKGHLLLLSSRSQVGSLVRMSMFVVNSAHFVHFLQYLSKQFSEFFYDMTLQVNPVE